MWEVYLVNKECKRGEREESAWYRTVLSPARLEFFLIIVYVTAANEQRSQVLDGLVIKGEIGYDWRGKSVA